MINKGLRKQAQERRKRIAHHDELYYKNAAPEISDFEYDQLKQELSELESAFPELKQSSSPSQTVGDDRIDGFQKYMHREAMRSLDNTYSQEELFEFEARLIKFLPDNKKPAYIIEPKIDGVAVSLSYEKGQLKRAVTRGNGTQGDDITKNIGAVQKLAHQLSGTKIPDFIEIRGEIYMQHAEFERINHAQAKQGLDVFANPRNLTAGTIKQLHGMGDRKLDIILYGIGYCSPNSFSTQNEFHKSVQAWGLPSLERYWRADGIEQAWQCIEELDSIRNQFSYDTDGAVIKLDCFEWQQRAGHTAKAPRWAIAYKFAAEQIETRLNRITVQIGRTGTVTPVAELQPVQLSGSTVSRATLHNEDEIRRKDIRPGDIVTIQKAGEIIPQVLRVNLNKRSPNSKPFNFNQFLINQGIEAKRVAGQAVWKLINSEDPEQQRRKIAHFASKPCMDIETLGIAVVDLLISNELITDASDLYRLTFEDLTPLERFASKSASNLIHALEESKKQALWRLIHGLGIPNIGAQAAKLLSKNFRNLKNLMNATPEELLTIDGIGDTIAQSIQDFFKDPKQLALVNRFIAYGLNTKDLSSASDRSSKPTPFIGKTFVLTGTLPTLSRTQASEKIEAAGGKTSSSISSKTDYLLAGESAGSKLTKAQKLGVEIIDEANFLEMIQI